LRPFTKVLPYTSGAYSPTTTKALTFNNDLFLGDLKVQIKFQGKGCSSVTPNPP
jgi:hypothetical protein